MHSGNAFTGRLVVEPKQQNVWGLGHAIWFFCMGLGSGLYLNRLFFGIEIGKVLGMSLADVLGIVLVGIGGLILIADLGRPMMFLMALRNWRQSWITWGAIADFLFMTLGVLMLLPDLELGGAKPLAGLPLGHGSALGQLFTWVSVVCAVYIIVYPGLALSFSPSIPFWNTTLIPLQYLGSALAGSAGVAYLLGATSAKNSTIVGLIAVLATLAFTVFHVVNARQQRGAARLAADMVTSGTLAAHFVWGNLVLGLILPAVALAMHLSGGGISGSMLAVTGALILAGSFLSKYAVIKAGHYAPLI